MRRGIDHVVLCVRDLEAARRRYGAFGFTTTPPALHPWGTANSLIQLQGNFIELLAVAEPERIPAHGPGRFSFGAFNRDFLARHQGISMLVFQSRDARRDCAEFAAGGLQTYEPFDFSRSATLPDGSRVTVAFSLAFVTDPRMPDAVFFTCQQHAPEHFWKPEYQRHANGATAIAEVVMVAPEPIALTDFFTALQGADRVGAQAGRLTVDTGFGHLTVLTPPAFADRFPGTGVPEDPTTPRFAALRVTVTELGLCEPLLAAQAGPVARSADGIYIEDREAGGVVLELAPAPLSPPPS